MRELRKDESDKITSGRLETVANYKKYLAMEILSEAKKKMFDASVLFNKCESLMTTNYHEKWFRDAELLFARIWGTAIEEFECEIAALEEHEQNSSIDEGINELISRLDGMISSTGFSTLGGIVKIEKDDHKN